MPAENIVHDPRAALERMREREAREDAEQRIRDAAADLLAAAEVQELWQMGKPNPWGHNCRWCHDCTSRIGEMRRAAIAKARGDA